MKMLTKQMQSDISRQIYNKARDIDVAIYNALEGVMPKEFVLDALMFYMTKDGGFAGGLYIDNYNTNASVYQVYEALRIMDMVEIDRNCKHELFDYIINKSMNYLYNRAEIIDNCWNPNVLTNNEFAHSMEFEYNEENRKLFGYAPTAAILGYTLEFCNPTKAYYKKALKMADKMIKEFFEKEALSKYEFISLNQFIHSAKKMHLYSIEIENMEKRLIDLAKKQVSLDFTDNSKIHPLDCALYLEDSALNEMIEEQLDFIIDSIAPHGLWEYPGNWGYNTYAEEDSAKLKWIGAISVNYYFYLKKYGRIE